jgi:periplasmic protein CpxP/Spy
MDPEIDAAGKISSNPHQMMRPAGELYVSLRGRRAPDAILRHLSCQRRANGCAAHHKETDMSDVNPAAPQPSQAPQPLPGKPRKSFYRKKWFIGLAFAAVAVSAFGAGRVSGRISAWHMQATGMHGGHGGPAGRFGWGPERFIDRVLSRVSATEVQKQKIEVIARDAFAEMRPLRQQRRLLQGQLATLLKAETVDRAAIDRLRAEQIAMADTVTQRWSRAIVDAAEVLTPAQRQELVARWENRRGWFMRG